MTSLKYSSFFGLFLLFQSFLLARCGLPCPLEWESASSGSIPDQAIESSPGEYVARILLEDWHVTTINPKLGKIAVIVDGKEVSHEDYEVLTNPHNCIINWIRTSNKKGSLPPDGVVRTKSDGTTYVGRGKYDGHLFVGMISENGLDIEHKGKQTHLSRYDIITAIYPKLYGSLSNIKFTVPTSFYENAYQELVGSSLLEVISITGAQLDNETVFHEKVLNENFIFEEDSIKWAGISSLQVSFHLWFGTSDIKQLVQINGKDNLEIERSRELKFSKYLYISSSRNIQVCTLFLKPAPGATVTFEATAELTADGDEVTLADIEAALQATGRPLLRSFPESKTVTTTIKGTMTGRFALDIGSIELLLERKPGNNLAGKCASINDKPRSAPFS